MPQYSLTGSPLDAAVPGQYYDPADMQRRRAAEAATNAALANPNIPPNKGVETRMEGLAYDYEGLLRSVAIKYGLDAAKRLVEMLPNMSRSQLLAMQQLVQRSASEMMDMDARERMAYERAGMQYKQGQYQPK